jgi:hypothetical protein
MRSPIVDSGGMPVASLHQAGRAPHRHVLFCRSMPDQPEVMLTLAAQSSGIVPAGVHQQTTHLYQIEPLAANTSTPNAADMCACQLGMTVHICMSRQYSTHEKRIMSFATHHAACCCSAQALCSCLVQWQPSCWEASLHRQQTQPATSWFNSDLHT